MLKKKLETTETEGCGRKYAPPSAPVTAFKNTAVFSNPLYSNNTPGPTRSRSGLFRG